MEDTFKFKSIHVTPSEEELLPNYVIKCRYDSCTSKFKNNGSYLMHKEKHHKIPLDLSRIDGKLYHCPNPKCKYNIKKGEGFKDLRYLRQHYQKVHLQKNFSCTSCGKNFITLSKLKSHICGEKFTCNVCFWQYDSREALLTHAKRKKHGPQESKVYKRPKLYVEPIKHEESTNDSDILKEYMDKETQTKGKRLRSISVQTETALNKPLEQPIDFYSSQSSNLTDTLDMLWRDIETQTDYCFESTATMTCDPTMFDQELGQNASTNMCTQTSANILRELGLCDIETQTYWPQSNKLMSKPKNSDTVNCSLDELLVSTETQTSFTQCLLDSCRQTVDGSTNTTNNDVTNLNTFYNTQHTQTCKMLYSDLFDDDERLIGSFQSSFSQT